MRRDRFDWIGPYTAADLALSAMYALIAWLWALGVI